jgi:hypothetical protein
MLPIAVESLERPIGVADRAVVAMVRTVTVLLQTDHEIRDRAAADAAVPGAHVPASARQFVAAALDRAPPASSRVR